MIKQKIISTKPPVGTNDWRPDEFLIRKYIFDVWRKVCLSYGYQEYLTPLLEFADLYRAKSGEDISGNELLSFKDRGGRELSIRPEMTPSVSRMLAQDYKKLQKPIKYFSIANFYRNEKPQKGRNREFWQLNYDCFGSKSIYADIEIAQIAMDIMLEFGAPKKSFSLHFNSREIIDYVLNLIKARDNRKIHIVRLLDKINKISKQELKRKLQENGLENKEIDILFNYLNIKSISDLEKTIPALKNNHILRELKIYVQTLKELGYKDYIKFNPSIIRGFDYYNGIVFEVFDNSENNNRSIFGGGRYDGLTKIFGVEDIPALGCAPGDETTKNFLSNWGLLDKASKTKKTKYYLPLFSSELVLDINKLAGKLRKKGLAVEISFRVQNFSKALKYANQKEIDKVIILAENEKNKGIYKIKDMSNGQEKEYKL